MKIYEQIISAFYAVINGDNRYKYYKKLRSNLNLSRNEIIQKQKEDIQKLIHHAYHHTLITKSLWICMG